MVCPKGTGRSKRHIWEPVYIDGFIAQEKGLEKSQWQRKHCLLCDLEVDMKFDENEEEIKRQMEEQKKEKTWSVEYG
ncbi:MAG TPA: hypothetical protein ENI23_11340 [bacterium]|nr:hypothetical protein [bacterium]